jgi:hypothetical protein
MHKNLYIKFFLILTLVGVVFGYVIWRMWQERSGRMQAQNTSVQQQTAPIPSTGTIERSTIETDRVGWKIYHNEELGMSFSYPEKYCVGSFTREILSELGYKNSSSSPKYVIRVGDSHITDCLAPFEPGSGDIFQISVFVTQIGKTLEEWRMEQKEKYNPKEDVQEFWLPSINIDGTTALRFLSGEGTTNTGASYTQKLWMRAEAAYPG